MAPITLPDGYALVLAAATSTVWLNVWQTTMVSRSRKRANIAYPQVYAEKAEVAASKEAMAFNCTQRAHQNTLETLPTTLVTLLVSGLRYPQLAASLGGLWVFSRVLYTLGYSTGSPSKRMGYGGFLQFPAAFGLALSATYAVYKFVAE